MSENPWQRLADELEAEVSQLQAISGLIARAQARFGESQPDELDLYIPAGMLQDLYHGIESILLRVAKNADGQVPGGPDWHRTLLDQMSRPYPAVRPALLSSETAGLLEDFCRFRHVARNIYGFELDWARIKPLLDRAELLIAAFSVDLGHYAAFLRMRAHDLGSP